MSIQDKQNYLRTQIIDNGYEGDEFVAFVEQYFSVGQLDLELHSLAQLQQVVLKFIASKQELAREVQSSQEWVYGGWAASSPTLPKAEVSPPKGSTGSLGLDLLDLLDFCSGPSAPAPAATDLFDVIQPAKTNLPTKQQFKKAEERPQPVQVPPQGQAVPVQPLPVPNPAPYPPKKFEVQGEVRCRKQVLLKKLDVSNLEVVVADMQVRSQSFFKLNYAAFILHIKPFNIEVERRISDFQTLRQALCNYFPNVRIPLFERVSKLNEADPENMRRQGQQIEYFLGSILDSPVLRLSRFTEDFLLMQDGKQFKLAIKDMARVPKPRGIEQLFTLDGKQEIRLGPQFSELAASANALLNMTEVELQKIRYLFDQVSSNLQALSKNLSEVSAVFGGCLLNVRQFNIKHENSSVPVLEKILGKLQQLHSQLSVAYESEGLLVERILKGPLKYQRSNLSGLRDIIKTRASLFDEAQRRGIRESPGEYAKGMKDKTGVDVPSKESGVLVYQVGAYNMIVAKEVRSSFSQLGYSLNSLFKSLAKMKNCGSDSVKLMWAQFLQF